MLQAIGSILHSNHHSTIGNFPDIYYLIKLLANKSSFCEYLGRDSSKSPLPDLFVNNTALLVRRILLAEYISSLQGNWGTKESSYNTGGKDNNVAKSKNNTVSEQERDLENNNDIDN